MLKRLLATATVATLALAVSLSASDGGVTVSDPFARETPPNAKVGGAYMTLTNHGAATVLVAVGSDAAERVEIHDHIMDEGVMRMREVEGGIPLGMHETVTLRPGGYHVMLMGLKEPLRKGGTVDLTLEFDDGSTLDLTAPILSIAATGAKAKGHGDHGHGDHGKTHDH